MNKLNKYKTISVIVAFIACAVVGISNAHSQAPAPVRGEVSAGVYENIKSTSQALNVNILGATNPATDVTFTTTTPTVTNSSGTLLAANTARKSVLIQNNDTAGIVYLNFTTTATTAHLQIRPGQSIFMSGILPSALIRAIGSIASNANVVVIEGQ